MQLTLNTSQHGVGCSPIRSITVIAGAIVASVLCEMITIRSFGTDFDTITVSVACGNCRKKMNCQFLCNV